MMEVIVFEKESYYQMQKELVQLFKQAIKEAREEAQATLDPANDWLSTSQAKELLGIRSKTKLQELRDVGSITFTKHGRIIRYSKKSILDYLERNIPAY
ncbi:MAG: helix-turn-helix domain-containing protein [Cyclobacteriaceae bacterium]